MFSAKWFLVAFFVVFVSGCGDRSATQEFEEDVFVERDSVSDFGELEIDVFDGDEVTVDAEVSDSDGVNIDVEVVSNEEALIFTSIQFGGTAIPLGAGRFTVLEVEVEFVGEDPSRSVNLPFDLLINGVRQEYVSPSLKVVVNDGVLLEQKNVNLVAAVELIDTFSIGHGQRSRVTIEVDFGFDAPVGNSYQFCIDESRISPTLVNGEVVNIPMNSISGWPICGPVFEVSAIEQSRLMVRDIEELLPVAKIGEMSDLGGFSLDCVGGSVCDVRGVFLEGTEGVLNLQLLNGDHLEDADCEVTPGESYCFMNFVLERGDSADFKFRGVPTLETPTRLHVVEIEAIDGLYMFYLMPDYRQQGVLVTPMP